MKAGFSMANKKPLLAKWISPDYQGVYCWQILGISCPLNYMPWYTWLDLAGWWWPMFRYAYYPWSLNVTDTDDSDYVGH
jgi:hypothetical protein